MIGSVTSKVLFSDTTSRDMLRSLARDAAIEGHAVDMRQFWESPNWWFEVTITPAGRQALKDNSHD